MTRIVVNILLFFLPFAVFFGYAFLANRQRATHGADALRTPWFWLLAAALTLAIMGFVAFRVLGAHQTGQYIPAHMENGRLVPGHFDANGREPGEVPAPQSPPAE